MHTRFGRAGAQDQGASGKQPPWDVLRAAGDGTQETEADSRLPAPASASQRGAATAGVDLNLN